MWRSNRVLGGGATSRRLERTYLAELRRRIEEASMDWLVPDPRAKWKLDVWARDAHEFIFSASPCTFFPPCTRHQFPCIPCRPSLYGRLAISSLTYTSILKRRSCGHSLPPSSLSLSRSTGLRLSTYARTVDESIDASPLLSRGRIPPSIPSDVEEQLVHKRGLPLAVTYRLLCTLDVSLGRGVSIPEERRYSWDPRFPS